MTDGMLTFVDDPDTYQALRSVQMGEEPEHPEMIDTLLAQNILTETEEGHEIDCTKLYRVLCARCLDLADGIDESAIAAPEFAEDELQRDIDAGPAHDQLCRFTRTYAVDYLERIESSTIDAMLIEDLHEALSLQLTVDPETVHPQVQELFDFLDSVIVTTHPAYFAVKETVDELWG